MSIKIGLLFLGLSLAGVACAPATTSVRPYSTPAANAFVAANSAPSERLSDPRAESSSLAAESVPNSGAISQQPPLDRKVDVKPTVRAYGVWPVRRAGGGN